MAELTPEDSLRLNVMLAGDIQAIRIDAANMTIYGLSPRGTATVKLHSPGRADQYLRTARELLAGFAIGSPGGYPVYLQRWTRMGQTRDAQLDKLLLLGEPEAVVAVAGAAGLSDELARRAWWAMPSADIARRMLEKETVVRGNIGKELAAYLVEHLPFETDPLTIITTVRLVLQPGMLDADTCQRIWERGTHRNVYHIGFLQAIPDQLPNPLPARRDLPVYDVALANLEATGLALAGLLRKLLSSAGQTYLHVCTDQLEHPVDKETVAALLNTIGDYFRNDTAERITARDIETAQQQAEQYIVSHAAAVKLLKQHPELTPELIATFVLSCASETLVIPILANTSATGTLLRKKLEPVLQPLLRQFNVLRNSNL